MIGAGYVGLVSAVCFADLGHNVVCIDVDARKIEMLKRGEVPIYEPGLSTLIERNVAAERLQFTLDMAQAVARQHDKGRDAARVAVEMANLLDSI